jgi:hypothetical protein
MAIDRRTFFNVVKPLFGGRFTQRQVDGLNAILDDWEARAPNGDERWLAYMLATAFHETARTMQPVREAFWLSEEWRRRNLRYYPYYGRGYVQLTWRDNYDRAGAYLGVNLVANPDLALRADYAAAIMFVGMTEGWFRADRRGRRQTLARYFGGSVDDPVGAREIINGPERKIVNGRTVLVAEIIAGYHATFLSGLQAAPAGPARVAMDGDRGPELLDAAIDGASFASFSEQASAELGMLPVAPEPPPETGALLRHTVEIVTGYFSTGTLPPADIPEFITRIHRTLESLAGGGTGPEGVAELPSEYEPEDAPGEDAAGDGRGRMRGRKSRRKRGVDETPSA